MDTEDRTALAMVRLGYATDDSTDQHRVLNFRVGFNDAASAQEACRVIDSYNEFSGERVAAAIAKVAALPHARYSRFSVGREGSPVLYVSGLLNTNAGQIMALLKEAGPDECDTIDGGYSVRAWWD